MLGAPSRIGNGSSNSNGIGNGNGNGDGNGNGNGIRGTDGRDSLRTASRTLVLQAC